MAPAPLLQSVFRAAAAVATAAAATGAAYRDELRRRDVLATEFLLTRPSAAAAAPEGMLLQGEATPCDCSKKPLSLMESAELAPSLLDSVVGFLQGAGTEVVLRGPAAGAGTALALAFSGRLGDREHEYATAAVRSALLQAKPYLLLQAIKATSQPVLGMGIVCQPCVEPGVLGYYQPYRSYATGLDGRAIETGQLVVCSNRGQSAAAIAQTVAHELVHAYDQTRQDEHLRPCERRACTEVRAYNLTWSGPLMFQRKSQVRNGAVRSCAGACAHAREDVERALGRCFQDRAPFDAPSDRFPNL